jgi:hypothetical protein
MAPITSLATGIDPSSCLIASSAVGSTSSPFVRSIVRSSTMGTSMAGVAWFRVVRTNSTSFTSETMADTSLPFAFSADAHALSHVTSFFPTRRARSLITGIGEETARVMGWIGPV